MDSIEETLRQIIVARYGTMIDFAREIGMSNSTLASIMNRGIHKASVSNIIKICQALNISADGLASGQIIPNETEQKEQWNFKEVNEISTFIKITLTSSTELTINGEPLTDEDIQDIIDMIELSCQFMKRKIERRQEAQ